MKYIVTPNHPTMQPYTILEVGRWHEPGRLVFGNPEKNRPQFTPRWVYESFALPDDCLGQMGVTPDGQSVRILGLVGPLYVERGDYIARSSSGKIFPLGYTGFRGMVADEMVTGIYKPEYYRDRQSYWARCDMKVSYPL